MSDMEQLTKVTAPIVTQTGKTYLVPRPNLKFWMQFYEFQHTFAPFAEIGVLTDMSQITPELLAGYGNFMHTWLNASKELVEARGEIGLDEVLENFDFADLPAVMAAVSHFYAVMEEAASPTSAPTTETA